MNLDELTTAMKRTSSDPVVLKLSDLVSAWKDDESDAKELENAVERYMGNTWIANTAEHKEVYSLWSQFRGAARQHHAFNLSATRDTVRMLEDLKAMRARALTKRSSGP